MASLNFVALPSMDEYVLTLESNIVHCCAQGNYSTVHLADGSVITLSKKLKDLQAALNREHFVRVHHSHIVNLIHARKFVKKYGGQLVLSTGDIIDVSRSKKKTLFEKLTIV